MAPAELVERVALGARLQQPVLVGLAVHGDQRLGDLGQGGDRHRAPPTKARERPSAETLRASTTRSSSTSPPACSTAAASLGQLATRDDALDPGLLGARSDRAGVGPAAEQQAERGDDHGLAGAGLAGDRR